MGMPIVVDVRDDGARRARSSGSSPGFARSTSASAPTRPGSEISRLNRGELAVADCHADVRCGARPLRRAARGDRRVLRRALRLAARGRPLRAREGLVGRPRRRAARGGRGRATTRSTPAATSARAGRPCPSRPGGPGSSIPSCRDRIAAVVEANDLALATSGAYVRGEHIVDPHTGRPPAGLLSVTIAGERPRARPTPTRPPRSRWASRGPAWTATLRPYEALSLLADGTSLCDAGASPRARPSRRA